MSYFQTLDDPTRPVRFALIGAGMMGHQWLTVLHGNPQVELVGIADLDVDSAAAARDAVGAPGIALGRSLEDIVSQTSVDAIVNATVPDAHYVVNSDALVRGVSVLCEKPIVPTVEEATRMAATARLSSRLLMTSQSRRYYRTLRQFRDAVVTLGNVGVVSCSFHRGPRFGGFRDRMEHPLLLDMSIHAFDCARYLLGKEPLSVYCQEFNPPWSWYNGAAAAVATFEMEDGVRFVYDGSWCNEGLSTSWNGHWTVRGEHGSASWDGGSTPSVELVAAADTRPSADAGDLTGPEEIGGALVEFVHALRTGDAPSGDVHSNIWSLAMVEAALTSATTGTTVRMDSFLDAALSSAVANAESATIRATLQSREGFGGIAYYQVTR